MGTTPVYSLPFQSLTDPPDGASLGEDLALALEAQLARIDAVAAAAAAQVVATIPVQALVATSQATTSTTYTDLATVGPAVTVTTGTSALVIVGAQILNSTAAITAFMSFAVSGATTSAAVDAGRAVGVANANLILASRAFLMTGLTPGSNTFTAKYKVNGASTGTFQDRYIIVRPISPV